MKYILILLFTLFFNIQANTQLWNEIKKVVASDRDEGDIFGFSVSISNTFTIIGASREDEDASGENTMEDSGSAYIFEEVETSNWFQIQKLVSSDRAIDDRFGVSVSISGNYAIVGAELEDEDSSGENTMYDSGSAYIFERNENGIWIQVQKIVASDRYYHNHFGCSVAINGNYLIVGAQLASGLSKYFIAGSAYLFERNESGIWIEKQKIISSDLAEGDYFGCSVSINGNNAIVGSIYESEDASGYNTEYDAGSAYLFERDSVGNWNQIQKLVASDRDEGDSFGGSTSINGNFAIVSAWGEDEDASGGNYIENAGSAYLFEKGENDKWNQVQKIVASDRAKRDIFSTSVSINGFYSIVGAFWEDEDSTGGNTLASSGSAYLFKKDSVGNWNQIRKIVAPDRDEADLFGSAVSIDENSFVVGAYREDDDSFGGNTFESSGSVYISRKNTTSIIENNFLSLLKVYPNPTSGIINIELGKTYYHVDIIVRNLLGQIILTESFNVTNLVNFKIKGKTGFYFVELRTKDCNSAMLKILKN